MSKALVLIEVEDGLVSDVHCVGDVDYHVIDWDAADAGEEIEELSPEFEAKWPEVAEAVRKAIEEQG